MKEGRKFGCDINRSRGTILNISEVLAEFCRHSPPGQRQSFTRHFVRLKLQVRHQHIDTTTPNSFRETYFSFPPDLIPPTPTTVNHRHQTLATAYNDKDEPPTPSLGQSKSTNQPHHSTLSRTNLLTPPPPAPRRHLRPLQLHLPPTNPRRRSITNATHPIPNRNRHLRPRYQIQQRRRHRRRQPRLVWLPRPLHRRPPPQTI